ncbi:MAG: carbohydrate ABC transporter permease [Firmicutes bacterium]|nr:carbohydrate ABC transporter permease [Bacillota bacterium]MCD7783444.1 carbohydrate ABC transporter permease [Bacillota bacterium]MCD8311382.1 carbohydrate ABC transporter permease [Bacillota bacterium]MCD8315045.1 carbohydrate ABC transporter permease [Bacillota bacterium]
MAKKLRTRGHKVVLNRSRGGDAGITVFLVIMGVFMFLPMLYVLLQSVKPLDELWMYPPRFYVINPTLKNFSDLFSLMADSWVPFSRYIFNTVFISVAGTFGNLVFASLAAYALAKLHFPGRDFMFNIVVKSLMFTSTVTSVCVFIIMSWLGWIDTYLAVIVPSFGYTLGLYLMKQFMETNVADEILESARLDGASELYAFWAIAMPMVKPAWLTLIVYCFQGLWNSGSSIYIYSEQLKTLNYAISQITAGGIARAGASAAATVVMMLVPILVFVISQSNIIETMGSSGMKD